MDYKREMKKKFTKLRYRHDLYEVFTDFITMSAISISNAIDKTDAINREIMYKNVVSKYNKEELEIFPQLFADLVLWLEKEPTDALGELYMELGLGNKDRGQFFTPYSLCRMMAKMTCTDLDKHIAEKGYITVSEPACGAGANLIAFAMEMKEQGYNYQRCMYAEATDIDFKAAMMCYLQISLLGIPAKVNVHNTLSCDPVKKKDIWITPMYAMNLGLTPKSTIDTNNQYMTYSQSDREAEIA